MEKEGFVSLSHLLSAMKESVIKLEKALSGNDVEKVNQIKKEMLEFQKQIDRIL